jgi:hypothetical protein
MKKFYLTNLPEQPQGYVNISDSADWEPWIGACLPDGLDAEVKGRLKSNLKHVLVALEMKAALVVPHAERGRLLFEPYFQIMNFEFCVGVFSVCEGLGSALWLRANGRDGAAGDYVGPNDWKLSLASKFDATGKFNLSAEVDRVKNVRDKLHQDRLGARENIDWHAFSFDNAFTPAVRAMRCLLQANAKDVPENTNLKAQ